MQTIFNLKNALIFGLIFILTSCFYSAKYAATYIAQIKQPEKLPKELAIDFINKLADKNGLIKDTKYNGIDTLGFYGQPYHYFKFWFADKETYTIVKLDYWGTFGSRKNQPYKNLFNEMNEFMKANFIIIEQEIKEENNSKKVKS